MTGDKMVELIARYLAKPTDADIWRWWEFEKRESEYVEAHWQDYIDNARKYVSIIAPMIAAQEREECAKIAKNWYRLPGGFNRHPADEIADAIRARKTP